MLKKIILLFLITPALFAGHSGEIYTYGYFDFVRDTLLALSGVVSTDDSNLMKIISALAFLIFFLKNINVQKTGPMLGYEFAKFLVIISLVQQLFLTAPDDDAHAFAIVDRISNQTAEVRQIPKGLGELLSLFTRLEDAIMVKMEMHFSTPTSTSYRNAGLGFNMSAPMEIFQQTLVDTKLRQSFEVYFENCKMLGDFSDGTQDSSVIYNSTNLMTDLGTTQKLLTVLYTSANPEGTITDCTAAWVYIRDSMPTQASNMLGSIALSKGMTQATFESKATDAMNVTLNSAQTSQDALKEAMLRNASLDAIQKVSANLGIGAGQLIRNKSIAEMTMTNDAILSNLEAQGLIPIMKAVCLAFVISLSWLLAILSIATLNFGYLKMIITLNVWLMMWSPLYTVLNYAMDIMVSHSVVAYGSAIIENQIPIYVALGAKLAMLSKLVWAVPMLAFAIAKGSDQAMVSFISGMGQGIGSGVSSATGSDVATGVSGKVAYTDLKNSSGAYSDNTGMHLQSSTNGSYGRGNMTTAVSEDGTQVDSSNTGGTVSITGNGSGFAIDAKSTAIGAQQTQSIAQQATQSIAQKNSVVEATGATSSEGISKVLGMAESMKNGTGKTESETLGNDKSETIQKTIQNASTETLKSMEGRSFTAEIKNTEGESIKTDFKVGADGKIVAKAGIEILGTGGGVQTSAGMSFSMTKDGSLQYADAKGDSHSLKTDESFQKDYKASLAKNISESVKSNEQTALAWTAAHDVATTDSKSINETSQKNISEQFQKSTEAQNAYSNAASYQQTVTQNQLSPMLRNELLQNKDLKDTYLNEQGGFKSDKHQQDYAKYIQAKQDYWSQGGNEALKDFGIFANTYGNNGAGSAKEQTKTAETIGQEQGNIKEQVNDTMQKTDIKTPTKQEVTGAINTAKIDYSKNSDDIAVKHNNAVPPEEITKQERTNAKSFDSKEIDTKVNTGINTIETSRVNGSASLSHADPLIAKAPEALRGVIKDAKEVGGNVVDGVKALNTNIALPTMLGSKNGDNHGNTHSYASSGDVEKAFTNFQQKAENGAQTLSNITGLNVPFGEIKQQEAVEQRQETAEKKGFEQGLINDNFGPIPNTVNEDKMSNFSTQELKDIKEEAYLSPASKEMLSNEIQMRTTDASTQQSSNTISSPLILKSSDSTQPTTVTGADERERPSTINNSSSASSKLILRKR